MLNLQQEIKNVDGEPSMTSFQKPGLGNDDDGKPIIEAGDYRPVVLKDMVIKVLTTTSPENEKDVDEKLKKYELLKKVQFVDEVELTVEEKSYLCNLIGCFYQVVFTGQAIELINS